MPHAQMGQKTYHKLRGQGKQKPARIASAAAGSFRSPVGKKGSRSAAYDDWTRADLVKRARKIGIRPVLDDQIPPH